MAAGADATATFALDLESNVGNVAGDQASALEELRDQIQGGVAELRNMQAALRNLKGSSAVGSESISVLRDRIASHKAVVAQQQARYISLGGTFKATARDAKVTTGGMQELLTALKGAPGPLGRMAGSLGQLASSKLAAHGRTILLIGGLAALVAGLAMAGAAITRFGFAAADAGRSELLLLEGLSKHRNYWMAAAGFTRTADSADALRGMIDKTSDSVALGRDKINEFAGSLYRAGLRGGNLEAALEGVSIVAATQGEAAADAWKAWAMGAAVTGQSVRALADDVKARLGGIAARQLLSLDVQSRKLKENMGRIFRDVKIEKFLEGLSKVTELFSVNTSTGNALKVLAETLLNPIADGAAAVGPVVKDFFRGMVLGAQAITIAVLEVRLAFRNTFGSSELLSGISATDIALTAGWVTVGLLTGAVVALAYAMGAAAVAAFPLTAVALLVVGSFLFLRKAIQDNWVMLRDVDWGALAADMISGLVNGIASGAIRVFNAVRDLGTGAWKAFKQSIQSSSPSKLFFKAGYTVPEGITGGFDAGRPMIARAAARLVAEPRDEFADVGKDAGRIPASIGGAGEGGGAPAARSGGRNGPLVVIENLTVTSSEPGAQAQAQSVREELERILEGVAIHLAAEVPA